MNDQLYSSLEKKISSGNLSISIVGFGYIGSVIGAVLADQGYRVFGVDVRKTLVDEVNNGTISINEPGLSELIHKTVIEKKLSASTDFAVLAESDVIVVTVGTPLGENFDPDTKEITSAINSMAPHLKPGHLIILKSTVPPGTTEKLVGEKIRELKGKDFPFFLAFCPERLAEGVAIKEFRSIPVVIGGVDPASAQLSDQFWKKTMCLETIKVDHAQSAEMVKLSDNLWIDLNVALANEIALICQKLGCDALEVIKAANSLPKGQHHVNILAPSVGVGGYCLTKDPWFVHHLGGQLGIDIKTAVASRNVNDAMPARCFERIEDHLTKIGKRWSQVKVGVLGIAFKNNTGDCRYTPTKQIIQKFEASGCQLEICDPWVNDHDAKTVTTKKLNTSIEQVMAKSDVLVFLTGHDQFKQIGVEQISSTLNPKAIIFDGRNFMTKDFVQKLKEHGFEYLGVGR